MGIDLTQQYNKLNGLNTKLDSLSGVRDSISHTLFGAFNARETIVVDNPTLTKMKVIDDYADFSKKILDINADITTVEGILGTSPGVGLYQDLTNANSDYVAYLTGGGRDSSVQRGHQQKIRNIQEEINKKERELNQLKAKKKRYTDVAGGPYAAEATLRKDETSAIYNKMDEFDLTASSLADQSAVYGSLGITTVNLAAGFRKATLPPRPSTIDYALTDTNGAPLVGNPTSGYKIKNSAGQELTVKNIRIIGSDLELNNVIIDPVEGVSFPVELEVMVRGRIVEPISSTNLDHFKTIKITIDKPTLTEANRQREYDTLNPTGGAGSIDRSIATNYTDNLRKEVENKTFQEMLHSVANPAEVDEVFNDAGKKKLFLERARVALGGSLPILNLGNLQMDFRTYITHESRDIPVKNLISGDAYRDYLIANLTDEVQKYLRKRIKDGVNIDPIKRGLLKQFLDFRSDVFEGTNDDGNEHSDLFDKVESERTPTRFKRFKNWITRKYKNNHTKFYTGRTQDISNREVLIEGEPFKYGINLTSRGVSNFELTIDIAGKDEPEIISAANHDELVKAVLRRAATKDGEPLAGKARSHIALDVMKAIVKMSPQKLERKLEKPITINGDNYDRLEAQEQNGGLIIRCSRVDPSTMRRVNVVLFDEKKFLALYNAGDLEKGILEASSQIESIMEAVSKDYQKVVRKIGSRSLKRYGTRQFFRGGHIKRLRGRMRGGKTNSDFSFSTQVNHANKNVSINFEKGEFTLSGNKEGEPFEFKKKSLGLLLRKKMGKERIFDGMELEMVEKINEEFIKQLRTNNMISTSSFGVADFGKDKTGRVYILDDKGDLSYQEIKGRGTRNPIPNKKYGKIASRALPPSRIRCNESERREFFQNPHLAGKMIRAMRRNLALF